MTTNLNKAKRAKQDEFYTQRADIENELRHYVRHFKDKVVYLNCDDPTVSNFWFYFQRQFAPLGLKKLIATCYKNRNPDMFSRHDDDKAICPGIQRNAKRLTEYPTLTSSRCGHCTGTVTFGAPSALSC